MTLTKQKSQLLPIGIFALMAFCLTPLSGCGSGTHDEKPATNTSSRANSLASMRRVTVSLRDGNATSCQYVCWIAGNDSQRNEAMSFISESEIPAGHGMILVYSNNYPVAFSGRNTLVNLDVVFAQASDEGVGKITEITTLDAYQRIPLESKSPVKYVLMVRRGDVARSNAKINDPLFARVKTPTQ